MPIFCKIIPNQIIESEVITKFREAIKYAVILESNIYNERLIKNKHTINKLIDNYFDYKDNKTEKSKKQERTLYIDS